MCFTFSKPKFYKRCKSYVKRTKMRVDAIKKKKIVIQKILKNDIVDLLKGGFHHNAYGKAEYLLIEQDILSCHNFIDEFCETISNQLSLLTKQRECPDDCREAVESLIYAAARFNLPELRDLRSLFIKRYGSSIEAFTNKEFVEMLRAMPVSKEAKLQLLQEIAQESSIEWNSKALEQQQYTPPRDQPKLAPVSVYERKTNSHGGGKDISDDDSVFDSSSGEGNTTETSTRDGSTDQDVHRIVSEGEDSQKPVYRGYIQPPYLKHKLEKKEAILEEPYESVSKEKPKPKLVRQRKLRRPLVEKDNNNDGAKDIRSSRIGGKEIIIQKVNGPRDGEDSEVEKIFFVFKIEEKMLNVLLMHCNKTKTTKGDLKYSPRHHNDLHQRHRNTKKAEDDVVVAPVARARSLPPYTTICPTETATKRLARSVSLEPRFVHPKLPDYDQLVAKFEALRREKSSIPLSFYEDSLLRK